MIISLKKFSIRLFFLISFYQANANDEVKFKLNWHDEIRHENIKIDKDVEILNMRTIDKDQYTCNAPIDDEVKDDLKLQNDFENHQIDTSSLISSIYDKKLCSYRIESYWIYELCHGQFVKQYHETKNSGKRSIKESYFLGHFNQEIQEPDYQKIYSGIKPNIQWRTLDGKLVATYPVKYTDGTKCEVLPDMSREITILYACSANGNDNIVTFEEISSCVYEMIVLTKSICSHPSYRSMEKRIGSINCFSKNNSPVKPVKLLHTENEINQLKSEADLIKMTDNEGETFIIHYQKTDSKIEETEEYFSESESTEMKKILHEQNKEKAMIASFLNGENCLKGGSGWWMFEICYGKSVMQYHEDENTKNRINVLLGVWNVENHLSWIEQHKLKRTLADPSKRNTISLLYSNGQICEGINKNRYTEVKFKCVKDGKDTHTVSLYLSEPNICEYVILLESPWFCDLVDKADVNDMPTDFGLE